MCFNELLMKAWLLLKWKTSRKGQYQFKKKDKTGSTSFARKSEKAEVPVLIC